MLLRPEFLPANSKPGSGWSGLEKPTIIGGEITFRPTPGRARSAFFRARLRHGSEGVRGPQKKGMRAHGKDWTLRPRSRPVFLGAVPTARPSGRSFPAPNRIRAVPRCRGNPTEMGSDADVPGA